MSTNLSGASITGTEEALILLGAIEQFSPAAFRSAPARFFRTSHKAARSRRPSFHRERGAGRPLGPRFTVLHMLHAASLASLERREDAKTVRLQEAVVDCNESLRLRPGDGNTLGNRGLAYLKLKKLDLALTDYDASLQANPNASALYGRGIAKRLRGDKAGADADIAAAEQISPDIAEDFERYGVDAP
jgi:tetratricopeptide (TPR) repeat protein